MKSVRERFEEIWPVPEGIEWADDQYVTIKGTPKITIELIDRCVEWDARLDTFTRCQETQSEIERALAGMLFAFDDGVGREWSEDILDYARKLVAAKEYVK